MVLLRFLVAMGVGGEWAVASAMVAEVMPKRSRPVMSSIFHASSVFGTLMAVAVGYFIISQKPWGDDTWRLGFLIGIVPALLVVVIRWKMKEPVPPQPYPLLLKSKPEWVLFLNGLEKSEGEK